MPATLWGGARWLAAGWLLALSSGFGQTFFISIFAGHLQRELGLTAGGFGAIYSAATLASAGVLMVAGRVADRPRLRGLAVGILVGLAVMAAGVSLVGHALLLAPLLFGLRFFGQGMLGHVAMTGMARWFPTARGKAVSVAALGFPSAEAVLPMVTVVLIGWIGWRETWLAGTGFLLLVSIPAILLLLAREPQEAPAPAAPRGDEPPVPVARQWTRAEVLRDRLFYALQPGVMAPPFVLTGIFFSQVRLVEAKGWDIAHFAAAFPVYAGMTVVSSLIAGVVVDRWGARRVLPGYLVPLALSTLLFSVTRAPALLPVAMGLAGITAGAANTLLGALWAELYGTRHLGAIRGLATSGLVFASALSPALVGLLADAGIGIETVLLGLAVYVFAAAAMMTAVALRMGPRPKEPAPL
jgi:MFS family permease